MAAAITEVVVLHWPDDEALRYRYLDQQVPMLWIVPSGAAPPSDTAILEDWARTTADAVEIQARLAVLAGRSQHHDQFGGSPRVDENGIVRRNGTWVALGPIEAKLAAALFARPGVVITRAELCSAGWSNDVPTSRALDVQVLRLRRHLEPLRIRIENVRGHGYVVHTD